MTDEKQSGGNILNIQGNINITQGDFVAGDKRIAVERRILFEELFELIEKRSDLSPESRAELRANAEEFKREANRDGQADESFLAQRLRNIGRIAPDIADVVLATVTNPAAGFAMVIQKVAEKARAAAHK